MAEEPLSNRLDRPVDHARDHILGSANASITLVEYGSYACPYCRAANEEIAEVRDQFGERLRYVFRHRPLTGSDIARRAAELVEAIEDPEQFWEAHMTLMTRSETLTEADLVTVRDNFNLTASPVTEARHEQARNRVTADESSAQASGVRLTPTFFINGRRYVGPWDRSSLADAMLGRLGHRMRSAALGFVSWGPSAGLLLLVATALAVAIANSPFKQAFDQFWDQPFGVSLDNVVFQLSLRGWIDDALLTMFFLVVGLEIKREFTVGRLNKPRTAALPVIAAFGGMLVPALVYLLVIPGGAWAHGWAVPMTTDTAFAVALIAILGRRVPVELRVFLTAVAIVDDLVTIVVLALFYSNNLHLMYLALALGVVACLTLLNYAHVYRVAPYASLGVVLWACVHASGLNPTLTGVVLALYIPTRPPANLKALVVQANTIIATEARHEGEVLRHGPSEETLRSLDAIHDRMESPADRLLRYAGARSSYVVLPLFALVNAGVEITQGTWASHGLLMLAVVAGLTLGKPIGLVGASALAVAIRLAVKPAEYSWGQLIGAGALAGIGFTMSLFIASLSFPVGSDFAAAKIAVLLASLLSALIGAIILWRLGVQKASAQD